MNHFNIFGAGGHTRSLVALLKDQGIKVSGIYDDSFNPQKKEWISLISLKGTILSYDQPEQIILSIGDNQKRKRLYKKYLSNVFLGNIFHSTSHIEDDAKFGKSNFLFANSVVSTDVTIGDNNIINTGSIIEHESIVGSHNHISVGAILCGRSNIGNNCFIGAGTVVIDKVNICDDVTIGANSVVINSISYPGTYVGNPIRKIK